MLTLDCLTFNEIEKTNYSVKCTCILETQYTGLVPRKKKIVYTLCKLRDTEFVFLWLVCDNDYWLNHNWKSKEFDIIINLYNIALHLSFFYWTSLLLIFLWRYTPTTLEFLSEVKQGLLKSEEIAGRIDLRFSYLLTFKTDYLFWMKILKCIW